MERNAKHHVMGMLKGGGMHQLLCLWARGLLLCQLERRERRNSSGRKRRKKGGNKEHQQQHWRDQEYVE